MNISYDPNNTFFARVEAFDNPPINGFTAIGIHVLTISGFMEENVTVKCIDLYLVLGDSELKGKLISARTNDLNSVPCLMIEMPPKIEVRRNWINVEDIYGIYKQENRDEIKCSGLFVFSTTKRNILECNTCRLVVTDSSNNKVEKIFDLPMRCKNLFRDGNPKIQIY